MRRSSTRLKELASPNFVAKRDECLICGREAEHALKLPDGEIVPSCREHIKNWREIRLEEW